jgi:hypothetical protein
VGKIFGPDGQKNADVGKRGEISLILSGTGVALTDSVEG